MASYDKLSSLLPHGGFDGPPCNHGSARAASSIIWSGVIARRGLQVCRARSVPIGNRLESPLPKVVNCSSRTNLDELKRQYNKASGFDAVCFYPKMGEDVGPFNKFLHFFTKNDYIGVCEYADGKFLFLVPPSEFISNILKSMDPRGLYGVVFKSIRLPIQSGQVVLNTGSSDTMIRRYLHTLELAKSLLIQSGQVKIDSGTGGQVAPDSGSGIQNVVLNRGSFDDVEMNSRFLPTLQFANTLVQMTQKLLQSHSRKNQQ